MSSLARELCYLYQYIYIPRNSHQVLVKRLAREKCVGSYTLCVPGYSRTYLMRHRMPTCRSGEYMHTLYIWLAPTGAMHVVLCRVVHFAVTSEKPPN